MIVSNMLAYLFIIAISIGITLIMFRDRIRSFFKIERCAQCGYTWNLSSTDENPSIFNQCPWCKNETQ